MMYKTLISRILAHTSSVTLTALIIVGYIFTDGEYLEGYLPLNGKPLVVFMLVSIVILYELFSYNQKKLSDQIDELSENIQIGNLKQAVNGLYGRFLASGDTIIDNEYTIKELAEMKDLLVKLKVNSYTQDRLTFLRSKIERK